MGRPSRCRFLPMRAACLYDRSAGRPRSLGSSRQSRSHRDVRSASVPDTGIAAAPRTPPHLPAGPLGTGLLVSFARSSLNVRWDPAFQSLLEMAEACDVPVRWSCRSGVCHNCETALIGGDVSYRPDLVEPPADGNALICCSRPRGDIVIDL